MAGLRVWMMCLAMAGLGGSASAEGLLGASAANQPAASPPAQSAQSAQTENTPSAPILPGSPTAVVKPFYEHPGLEIDPAQRGHFVDPAKTVLDKSDALRKSGQGECLDPNMALDNVDYDKDAIDKSFKTLESVNGDAAKVIVAFVVAGNPHRLEWKLKKVDGAWKISDLLSVTGEWALSQYQCE